MLYSILFAINYLSGVIAHDFHVSVCKVEFDPKNKAIEVTHRIFLDDLEETLKGWSNDPKIDVLSPKDPEAFQVMIGEYISERFSVTVNGKLAVIKYLGSEVEDDVMYSYMEVVGVKKLKSIEVKNTTLMDQFSDQVNLIHIIRDGTTKSLKLDAKKTSEELIFDY